jgi:cytoskeletal protein CcmA (bactofilin family)
MRAWLRYFGLAGEPSAGSASASTTLGTGITLKGELQGEGALMMLGRFEGDIVLDGSLHVGPEARLEGNVTARAIVVEGVVRGNLTADARVEILSTGSLTGTVKSGSFFAADGATVKGEVWVERPARPEERQS